MRNLFVITHRHDVYLVIIGAVRICPKTNVVVAVVIVRQIREGNGKGDNENRSKEELQTTVKWCDMYNLVGMFRRGQFGCWQLVDLPETRSRRKAGVSSPGLCEW